MKEECVCDGCNRPFNFHIYAYNNDPMISRYQNLAKDFRSLGYDASVKFYCIDCVKKETGLLAPIVFSFRINDMEKPVLSYPDYTEYNDQDYRLALDFLKGIILSELLERYDIEENGCVYADKIRRIIGPLDKPCKPPQDRRKDESEYMRKYKFPPR